LLRFLQRNHGYFHKEELIRIAKQHTNYSSENIGRRLRELEEDGLIKPEYQKGQVWYAAKPKEDHEAYAKELVRRFDAGEPVFV